MITEKTKIQAKAKLKACVSIEDVAAEFCIPERLVEEWATQLDPKDLVVQEATLHAIEKLKGQSDNGVIVLNEEILRQAIEETALDLTRHMAIPALNGDMVHAKAINLMADALVKMYQVIVLKGGVISGDGSTPNQQALDIFSGMMKD